MVAVRRIPRPATRPRRVTANWVYKQLVRRWGPPESNQTTAPQWMLTGRRSGPRNLDAAIGRDLDTECGYERLPQWQYYREMYDRVGPAHRAVNLWPDECWAAYPELYETNKKGKTEFEIAWADLARRTNPWHYLHRVDRLSGIGCYGVLFLGLDGGADPASPAMTLNRDGTPRANSPKQKLLYLRAFDQYGAKIEKYETNPASPRYMQPVLYQLQTMSPENVPLLGSAGGNPARPVNVHWTRTIHCADNRESSEVWGVPRLRPVLNILYDIRKIMGASAEMFYKGGFPGYQFETYPDLTGEAAIDEEDIRDEVAAYVAGLQRYLTAVGGKWSSLAPQVADPSKHLHQLFTLLCSTLGVPMRIMFGSESGQLASTQDAGTWKERLSGRQSNYLEPMLARPFVDRLMDLGALPRPADNYVIEWRDLRTLGEKDRADVFLKQSQALMQYATGGVSTYFPLRMALTILMGLTDEQADAVIAVTGENPKPPMPAAPPGAGNPAPRPVPRGGKQTGNPPRSARRAGRPARAA